MVEYTHFVMNSAIIDFAVTLYPLKWSGSAQYSLAQLPEALRLFPARPVDAELVQAGRLLVAKECR